MSPTGRGTQEKNIILELRPTAFGHSGAASTANICRARAPSRWVEQRKNALFHPTKAARRHDEWGSDPPSTPAPAFVSALLQVQVNDKVRLPASVGDGLLASTAAGSTAYARAMGASPLLVDTPGWLLVGSNVRSPPGWKSALLAMDARAELTVKNPAKRPTNAFVSGQAYGQVNRMRIRMSRIATVELAFRAQRDMAEKIAVVQFPE